MNWTCLHNTRARLSAEHNAHTVNTGGSAQARRHVRPERMGLTGTLSRVRQWSPCLTWMVLVVVLFHFVGVARAQCQACPPQPPLIPPNLVSSALSAASGGSPPTIRIAQSMNPRSKNLVEYRPSGFLSSASIVIYPKTIKTYFEFDGFAGPYFESLLGGLLYHELLHKCKDDNGGTDSADGDLYSCHHIAVYAATVAFACGKADEYADLIAEMLLSDPPPTPEQIQEVGEKKRAMCDLIKNHRGRMNTREGAGAAKACQCGSNPYHPPANCPELLIPSLPGSDCSQDYPGNNVIPECPFCPGS